MALAKVESRTPAAEGQLLDESSLDSEMKYRWVLDEPAAITKRMLQGYRRVDAEDKVRTIAGVADEQADGTIRLGDVVLMCCPKAEAAKRAARNLATADARLGSPTARFRDTLASSGAMNSRVLAGDEGER